MIETAISRLSRQDRQSLLVFAGYWLLGLVSNATRTSPSAPEPLKNAVAAITLLAMLAIVGFLVNGVRTRPYAGGATLRPMP